MIVSPRDGALNMGVGAVEVIGPRLRYDLGVS